MPGYHPPKVPKRPDRDSVPLIECEKPWCGEPIGRGRPPIGSVDLATRDRPPLRFCSLGCASRWAIRTELAGG